MLPPILQRNNLLLLPRLLLAALICFAAACKNNKPPAKKVTPYAVLLQSKNLSTADSLQLINDIDSADYAAVFKNKTNIWLGKSLDNSRLKWTNFHFGNFRQTTDNQPRTDTLTAQFLADYAAYLKWSPDSAYILDIGSYGVVVERDKSGKLHTQGGEPDNEIRMYNYKAKTSQRILFFEPSALTTSARWMDSSHVAMLSFYKSGPGGQLDTLLWLIDAKSNSVRTYIYHKDE